MDKLSFPVHVLDQVDLLKRIQGVSSGFRPQYTAIVFVKKGTVDFLVNGEKWTYGAQQLFFISNRNSYTFPVASSDLELYIVVINRNFRNTLTFKFNQFELFRMIAVELKNAIDIPEKDQPFTWSLLGNMHLVYNNEKRGEFDIDVLNHLQASLIYMIVGIIHLNNEKTQIAFNNRKQLLTSKFVELAFNNFIQEKELKFYADKLFVSIKYLSICVKEITGYPPTYILNQLALYEARIKLVSKEVSIAQVADELGFTDQYVFSKFFKKHMSISPNQFRKKALESVSI